MDFPELIRTRQSVRKYQDKPVEPEKIAALVEAFRLAPSACNSQPWTLIIVDEPELKDAVAKAAVSDSISMNKFAPEAPVIAVIVIERPGILPQVGGWLKNREFSLIDIGIAAEHLCLQATELGLGTCMLGWFDEKTVKTILNVPRSKRLGLMITIGYAAENYPLRDKNRKATNVMSRQNNYFQAEKP